MIRIIRTIGYVLFYAALGFILLGFIGVWMKEGFSAAIELMSPYNLINFLSMLITVAPGIGLIVWAEKMEDRKLNKSPLR